jgi:radical SAM superfamily enzyme YgiQ (UPF0313 family)
MPATHSAKRRAMLVDLNNFATFPTLAVGLLVASLRQAGIHAEVLCPLAHDVPAAERERQERLRDHLMRRVHLSTRPSFRAARDYARALRQRWINRPHPTVVREAARAMDDRPDIVLLSAYLQHYPTVLELGRMAKARGIPLLLGGPAFNIEATADSWRHIPGLTAIIGGEVDLELPDIVEAACAGTDLLAFGGVVLPDGRASGAAPPLRALDRIPIPDFSDFPWERYRLRVVPLMAGRGCQWAKCVFCSDVITASGRTFRTRSVDAIMEEMRTQAQRCSTSNFLFLDLKLNSDPFTFRAIIENVQRNVPGAEWIGTVHVDDRRDNGLSRTDLRNAVASGMRRVSFGLESGSQRLLDLMKKGSSVDRNSQFIRDAHAEGLSVRCTMFKGFPGETADDLLLTARFLESHAPHIDRIRFNEFSILQNTPIQRALATQPATYPQLKVLDWGHRDAKARYVNRETGGRDYRRAKARVLDVVYSINRRPVRASAEAFDGLM